MPSKPKTPSITPIAVAFELHCPECGNEIAAGCGSLLWDHLPLDATCRECDKTFKVKQRAIVQE